MAPGAARAGAVPGALCGGLHLLALHRVVHERPARLGERRRVRHGGLSAGPGQLGREPLPSAALRHRAEPGLRRAPALLRIVPSLPRQQGGCGGLGPPARGAPPGRRRRPLRVTPRRGRRRPGRHPPRARPGPLGHVPVRGPGRRGGHARGLHVLLGGRPARARVPERLGSVGHQGALAAHLHGHRPAAAGARSAVPEDRCAGSARARMVPVRPRGDAVPPRLAPRCGGRLGGCRGLQGLRLARTARDSSRRARRTDCDTRAAMLSPRANAAAAFAA